MIKPTKLIINRQKAAFNRKHKGTLPEEPTISIHCGSEIDYAFAVRLGSDWILKQNYAESPCSSTHIWLLLIEPVWNRPSVSSSKRGERSLSEVSLNTSVIIAEQFSTAERL